MKTAQQWKQGNEYLPYHPQASHVNPDHRDGWNACYKAAQAAIAQPVQPADHIADAGKMVRFSVAQAERSRFAYVLDGWGLTAAERFDTSKDNNLERANMRARYLNQTSAHAGAKP